MKFFQCMIAIASLSTVRASGMLVERDLSPPAPDTFTEVLPPNEVTPPQGERDFPDPDPDFCPSPSAEDPGRMHISSIRPFRLTLTGAISVALDPGALLINQYLPEAREANGDDSSGDTDEVRGLYERLLRGQISLEGFYAPLIRKAVRAGKLDQLNDLLRKVSSDPSGLRAVNAPDEDGITALDIAVKLRDYRMVEALLRSGAISIPN